MMGGLDVELTVPWPGEEHEPHGPDGPEFVFYVVQDGDPISEAKISGDDLAMLASLLFSSLSPDRFMNLGE